MAWEMMGPKEKGDTEDSHCCTTGVLGGAGLSVGVAADRVGVPKSVQM